GKQVEDLEGDVIDPEELKRRHTHMCWISAMPESCTYSKTTYTNRQAADGYDQSVTIGKTQNCTISASRTGVNNGGSVTYTVTPQDGYQLSTVMLRVGSQQATAAADSKAIKVGGKTYSMSLSDHGILKVTVSGIRDDVELSAYAAWEG